MLGFFLGLAGQIEESEEMFRKAKEFAERTTDAQVLKRTDGKIQEVRKYLKNRGK